MRMWSNLFGMLAAGIFLGLLFLGLHDAARAKSAREAALARHRAVYPGVDEDDPTRREVEDLIRKFYA